MIDLTDLLHPSPAPHFKTFRVLPIYFPILDTVPTVLPAMKAGRQISCNVTRQTANTQQLKEQYCLY